jgi:predicted enzyme related to lactoylglutathione lyase
VRLGFAVSDVDAAVEAIRAAGGSVKSRGNENAVLEDPDGRKVEVTSTHG